MATLIKSLLLLSVLVLIPNVYTHYVDEIQCGHHAQADYEPEFLDVEEDTSALKEGRVLSSSSYPNMRIYAFYDLLEESASSALYTYIKNDLAPAVLDFFESALRVKYPVVGNLKLGSSVTTVCKKTTPSLLRSSGVAADYVMLFDSYKEDTSVVASSKYCYLSTGTNRPLISTTSFNRPQFTPAAKGDILLHERNMYILIHEMMHTLGFSDNTYKYFIDENGKTRSGHIKSVSIAGKTRKVIDVPPLTQKLRNFYGCNSIPGAIMENDGGSGSANSHFERKFFVYETMSSGGIAGRRVSEFSLALLEGTGWYAPNYDFAEPYFYGKGQGCDFVNDKCSSSSNKFDEFCTGSTRGCSPTGRGGGKCSGDSKADGCKYFDPLDGFDCENEDSADDARLPDLQAFGRGVGSKCFTGDLNTRSSNNGATSFCFKYTCVGDGSDTRVQVKVGDDTITCTKAGSVSLDGYYGSVNCPDPETFCDTVGKKYCPRGCLGRGDCVNNQCRCNSGFTGVDCAIRA